MWYIIFVRKRPQLSNLKVYAIRAACATGAQYSLFFVLSHGTVFLGNLLYATSGLFAPLLTLLILKVSVPRKTILSIIISFIGVAIALGAWKTIFSPVSLMGLASGLLAAGSQITQHYASKKDDKLWINIMLFGIATLYSIPLVFISPYSIVSLHILIHPSIGLIITIVLFSFFSIANQTLKSFAFKYVNKAASLAPFFYSVIIFAAIIDWLVYGITPQPHIYLGIMVIILGGIVMSIRNPNKHNIDKTKT